MGKKKHRKHGGHEEHGDAGHGGGKKAAGAFAGIAAMAVTQVKAQLDTPAGRQMLATGLRAAADALAPKPPRTPEPPAPPPAPVPPEANGYAGNPAEPPRDPSPRADVPPEVARVIGSVAAGLEKWAAKLGVPKS